MFFSADWCPHCKSVLNAWDSIKLTLNNTFVNGFKIECLKVDCSDPDEGTTSATMAKYNVSHFPTLILAHPTGFILFDAKITAAAVTDFVVQKTSDLTV
jgi:thiol-disulfide isomerase/thioredoxin